MEEGDTAAMTIEIRDPKVGIVFFSFLMEQSLAQERIAHCIDRLQSAGLDIAMFASVRSAEEARGTIKELSSAEIDLAILAFADWRAS